MTRTYSLDPRKLLHWSCSDLPLVLAGLAALFSWASMPEMPMIADPATAIKAGLNKVGSLDCTRQAVRLQQMMSATSMEDDLALAPPTSKNIDDSCVSSLRASCPGCSGNQSSRGGEQELVQQKARQTMRVAYFLMLAPGDHEHTLQLLFRHVLSAASVVLIHVDAKAPLSLHDAPRALASQHSNVFVLEPSERITWGGYSIVRLQLHAMRWLLEQTSIRWDYVINLSGQDIPLRSGLEVQVQLSKLAGASQANFLQAWVHNSTWEEGWMECDDRVVKVAPRRGMLRGVVRGRGSQWWALHREFVEFIVGCLQRGRGAGSAVGSGEGGEGAGWRVRGGGAQRWASRAECRTVQAYDAWAVGSLIPDESYFQTLLFNSPFCRTLRTDPLRFVNWTPPRAPAARPSPSPGPPPASAPGEPHTPSPATSEAPVSLRSEEPLVMRRPPLPRQCARKDVVVGGCGNSPDLLLAEDVVLLLEEVRSGRHNFLFARKSDPRYDPRIAPLLDCWLAPPPSYLHSDAPPPSDLHSDAAPHRRPRVRRPAACLPASPLLLNPFNSAPLLVSGSGLLPPTAATDGDLRTEVPLVAAQGAGLEAVFGWCRGVVDAGIAWGRRAPVLSDPLQAASEAVAEAAWWVRWSARRADWVEARLPAEEGAALSEVRLFWGESGAPRRYNVLALRERSGGSEAAVVWSAEGGEEVQGRAGEGVRVSGSRYDKLELPERVDLSEGGVWLRVQVELRELGARERAEGVALAELQMWAEREEAGGAAGREEGAGRRDAPRRGS